MLTSLRAVLPAVILGSLLICAGCVEMPPEDLNAAGASSATSSGAAAPTATPEYMTSVTPFTTPTPMSTGSSKWLVQEPAPDTSVEIYNKSLTFKGNTVAMEYNLTAPPMTIIFEVTPVMENHIKRGTSQYGDRDEYSYNVKRPVTGAGFSVTVIDLKTGDLVDEAGFGGQFASDKKQSLKILYAGNYHIEMTGSSVDADVSVRVHQNNLETI